MHDINEAVTSALNELKASGAIEKAIKEQLGKTIKETISRQLESYSDFGKQLQGAIKEALGVDLQNLSLPSYGELVLEVARAQVRATMENDVAGHVAKNLEAILRKPPAKIKLSQLVEDFKNHEHGYTERDGEITLHIKASDFGTTWLAMDKDPNVSEYRCGLRFGVIPDRHDGNAQGRIFGLRVGGEDVIPSLMSGSIGNFARDLFDMQAGGTLIEVDGDSEHDFDLSYGPGEF